MKNFHSLEKQKFYLKPNYRLILKNLYGNKNVNYKTIKIAK